MIENTQSQNEELNNDKILLFCTDHAYKRAKERMGWSKKTLDKMIILAFKKGFCHADAKGRMKKYIDSLWLQYKTANNIRIYGEDIFFFKDNILLTLYRLPLEMIRLSKFF